MTGRYALIADLDLSTRLIQGYIVMATGFVPGNEQPGHYTQYTRLMIWNLP